MKYAKMARLALVCTIACLGAIAVVSAQGTQGPPVVPRDPTTAESKLPGTLAPFKDVPPEVSPAEKKIRRSLSEKERAIIRQAEEAVKDARAKNGSAGLSLPKGMLKSAISNDFRALSADEGGDPVLASCLSLLAEVEKSNKSFLAAEKTAVWFLSAFQLGCLLPVDLAVAFLALMVAKRDKTATGEFKRLWTCYAWLLMGLAIVIVVAVLMLNRVIIRMDVLMPTFMFASLGGFCLFVALPVLHFVYSVYRNDAWGFSVDRGDNNRRHG